MKYLIGVDESGTGAWAGPFMVSAVAVEVDAFNERVEGLNDSKKLSDGQRRKHVPGILKHAITTHTVTVPVGRIAEDHRDAWRWGVLASIQRVEKILRLKGMPWREFHIIIDGPIDKRVRHRLKERGSMTLFEHRADGTYPAVMAASILAKTVRNDAMIALDQEYPEFLWAKNSGYGTQEHIEALQRHGVTDHHRPIRRLAGMKRYQKAESWFEMG